MHAQAKAIAGRPYAETAQRALLLSLLVMAAYLLLIAPALATPMGDVLCAVVDWIVFGNLGRGLATLAVLVVGVGAVLGKASWGMAITVAVGISVIFGAHDILNALTGVGTVC
jgi:type IV secretory pathway VirB2 component (pilin)